MMRRRRTGDITEGSFTEPVDLVAEAEQRQFRALSSPLLNALAYCIVYERDYTALDERLEAAGEFEASVPESASV